MDKKLRMPDVTGADTNRLTDQEIDKLRDYFDEHRSNGPLKGKCEVCGQNNWKIWPSLHTLTIFDVVKDMHEHGQVHLVFTVSCDECGNIKQFDAEKAGLASKSGVMRRS